MTRDENSCIVEGLDNRQRYTFEVRAWNASGSSDPSELSAPVMPLAPGFQVWVDRTMAVRGDDVLVSVGNAPPGGRIVVTISGSRRVVLEADADGYAETVVTINRSGRVSVLAKSGRLTARAHIAVVRAGVAMPRVRLGRPVTFVVSAALPDMTVWVEFSGWPAVSGVTDDTGRCRLEVYLPFVGDADYKVIVGDVLVKEGAVRAY